MRTTGATTHDRGRGAASGTGRSDGPRRARVPSAAATVAAALALSLLLAGCSSTAAPSAAAPVPALPAPPPAAAPAPATAGAPQVIAPGRPGEQARVLPGSVPAGPASVSPADVEFVSAMIPHHEQALLMAGLAPQRAADPRVRAIADRIAGVQGAEIAMLRGWMDRRGGGAPAAGGHHGMSGHAGMGGSMAEMSGMRGMATPAQLDGLAATSGPAFDRTFLDLMIAHHEGAQDMARREQVAGIDETARQIADDVLSSQGVDIARMQAMYPA